jgi:N-acetylglucosamine kinase-like BadF-type ATPase
MEERYLISLDAGGTKTTAQGYRIDGTPLDSFVGDYGNVTVDFDLGMEHICQSIDGLTAKLGPNYCGIVLGCAGIETGDRKERALRLLTERYGENVIATNDAMLGLYAALKGQDGVLIIAGTGSIGYLKKDGRLERFGGWGHLINDDGSGYTIATRAIRAITDSYDAGCPGSPLEKAVFAHLGITELRGLIDFTYRSSKGEIAALVPVIQQTALEGDETAQEIFRWAGERLANAALTLLRRFPLEPARIAVSGSVLCKSELVNRRFREVLDGQLGSYELYDDPFNPTAGGYYLWKERCSQ